VVIDGGFDNGTTDWSTSNSVGEVIDDAGNKVMAIAVNTADFADVWNLALGQSYSYEANTTYSLSFRAKATVNREIRAGFGITVSPWSASWEPLNITTEWQVYTIERTPDFDASRVFIQMGGVDSTVYIDDMSVTYIDDTPEPVDTDTGAKDTFTLFNGSVDPALAVDSYDPDDNVQVTFEDDNSLHFVKTVTADSDSGNWGIRWPYSSDPTKNGIDLSAWEAEGVLVFDLKVNSADDVPLSIRIGNNWPNVSFGYVEPLPALDTWTEVRINIADMIVTGNPNTSEPDDTADISILHTFFIIEPEKGSMDLNFKNIRWEKPTSDTGTDPITDPGYVSSSPVDDGTAKWAVPRTCPGLIPSGMTVGQTTVKQDNDLLIDGVQRRSVVYLPTDYTGDAGYPLIILLSGSNGTPEGVISETEIEDFADTYGYVVIALENDHRGVHPSVGYWNTPHSDFYLDDMQMVRAAKDWAGDNLCISMDRVYGLGGSGGARTISRAACEVGGFSAIAPIIGVRHDSTCPTTGTAVSVFAIHGTADTINDYTGNKGTRWDETVPEAIAGWVESNGCNAADSTTGTMQSTHSTPLTIDTEAWTSGCTDNTEVKLYTVEGGVHQYILMGGRTDTTDEIIQFFETH
jgi:poly(3-hydroxybutyrate) depolymerase